MDAPAAEDISRCVHCGLCVNSCPTYAITGLEVESPRGRIHLMKAVADGRIPITATVQSHWELCLQCRACEAVCPSGVPYGRLMEKTRAQLDTAPPPGRLSRRARKFLLRNVVARPRVLAVALAPVRVLANSPLRTFAARTGVLRLVPLLARGERMLPPKIGAPLRAGDVVATPVEAHGEAILFTGCVMGELFGHVHRATARVLARASIRTVNTRTQVCCGALSAHDGDLQIARKLARQNIDALEGGDSPIVVNSAGCGAAMKEYGDLLAGDPSYAGRARSFSTRVRDVTEYVASLGMELPATFDGRVTYQDPCHLAHAQRVREQPRQLLRSTGCELVETNGADMCCGAAGVYSMVQPEMSAALRARKTDQFRAARPDVVVTANPGCQLQYQAAVREAGIEARVMHVMELLDEAQANAAAEPES
jgi:glycolate oxidase iron-sulfur subunit